MKHILDQIADYINTDQIQSAYNLIIENEESLIHNAEYWNMRGVLCLKVDEYNAAISCLANAIELEDTNGDYYYNYAYTLEKIGSFSDAALYYGRAYKFTENEEIRKELSTVYINNTTLNNIFMTAATLKKKKYIILSSNLWRDSYQRTHHIARSLVKLGNDVFYVEKPLSTVIESGSLITREELLLYSLNNIRKIDGVDIYSPIQLLNQNENKVEENYLELVQFILNSISNDKEEVVIISYLPSHINIVKSLEGSFFHLYDCVDDHSDLKYAFWGNKNDSLLEQELMDRTDAITTTATSLFLQRFSIEKRSNTYLSRNAVNEMDFINENFELPDDIANIPTPRIVFTGYVYKRFDEDLFYKVVEANPDKSFVIIGSIQEGMLIRKLPNLFLLGEKKHSELKKYLHHMQVGIVPYIYNSDMDIACDSIKQYEYLACGIPVISSYMPESGMEKIYTYLAHTNDEFNQALEECLSLEVDLNKIKMFLIENSWHERAALICNIASGEITPDTWKNNVLKIGRNLSALSEKYKSPIFDTIYAVYLNIFNSVQFEENMNAIYQSSLKKEKFIEKFYITSMIANRNYSGLKKTISQSVFYKEEIIDEVRFRRIEDSSDCIMSMAYYCVNDINNFKKSTTNIKDESDRIIYELYFSQLFDKPINYERMDLIEGKAETPLYKFIKDSYNAKQCVYLVNLSGVNINPVVLDLLRQQQVNIDGYCISLNDNMDSETGHVSIEEIIQMKMKGKKVRVLVNYDENYVGHIRLLAEAGIMDCEVIYIARNQLELITIDHQLMKSVKDKEYLKTVIFNKFNAADSNVGALLKYMPSEIKNNYKFRVIHGMDIYNTENVVKIPLWGSVTVSGFATFLYLPKFTFNIDVGHAGIILKSCGLMDKEDKNSGGNPEVFKKADIVCIASHMQKVVFSSFYAIPEDKYRITGLARNDMLLSTNGKNNLEKLLNEDFNSKKVIINMPTFHVFDRIGRIEGNIHLNDSFKIHNFDYEEFDDFLEKNNLVCISKVHHAEEISVTRKNEKRKLKNLFFIDNNMLDSFGLDLYEILNGADVLITDYSTVYNDFLFMNKPTVFVNTDIEEYRSKRGLALEPYEFWTAGPKVQTQSDLQSELLNSCYKDDYYKLERERLLPVFFENRDANSVSNTWKVIKESLDSLTVN
nr:CDP-glycerol glycerophosphotransferase family protein [Paenibacillus xylanexedens]